MSKKMQLHILPEDWERALAIVAHPDDLEYGAASAIARWSSQGKKVSYVILTKGEAGIDSIHPEETASLREAEERKSASLVGVQDVFFLDYQDGIIQYSLGLRRDIAREIRKKRPHILITLNHRLVWGDAVLNMADHRWTSLAVLDGARDAGNRWIFPELLQEGYEPWNGARFICLSGSPYPTHAVDVTSFLDKGIASLKQHKVYLDNLSEDFNVEKFLRQSAAETGKALGCSFAVSFEMIKI
jgi:LmbE family N-acetylglucosaminyl deacetylase